MDRVLTIAQTGSRSDRELPRTPAPPTKCVFIARNAGVFSYANPSAFWTSAMWERLTGMRVLASSLNQAIGLVALAFETRHVLEVDEIGAVGPHEGWRLDHLLDPRDRPGAEELAAVAHHHRIMAVRPDRRNLIDMEKADGVFALVGNAVRGRCAVLGKAPAACGRERARQRSRAGRTDPGASAMLAGDTVAVAAARTGSEPSGIAISRKSPQITKADAATISASTFGRQRRHRHQRDGARGREGREQHRRIVHSRDGETEDHRPDCGGDQRSPAIGKLERQDRGGDRERGGGKPARLSGCSRRCNRPRWPTFRGSA